MLRFVTCLYPWIFLLHFFTSISGPCPFVCPVLCVDPQSKIYKLYRFIVVSCSLFISSTPAPTIIIQYNDTNHESPSSSSSFSSSSSSSSIGLFVSHCIVSISSPYLILYPTIPSHPIQSNPIQSKFQSSFFFSSVNQIISLLVALSPSYRLVVI